MKLIVLLLSLLGVIVVQAQQARIEVHAGRVSHRISRYLTGACIEDVNHGIYGGIYSQMIFGESFQEPAPSPPLEGFTQFLGRWTPRKGELLADGGDGPKLVCNEPAFSEGEASVELMFLEKKPGNAGLIVKVSRPGKGADQFTGYEIALDSDGHLVLGRHRQNWEPIRSVPCDVPVNQWIALSVRMTGNSLEVFVKGKSVTQFEDTEHPLASGSVGLRTWQCDARFRNMSINTGGQRRDIPFELAHSDVWSNGISGMWRALHRGSAEGEFSLEAREAFTGGQSQRVAFLRGEGEVGLANEGLNRWGTSFIEGKTYDGCLWARAEQPAEAWVTLESRDGLKIYAEKRLRIASPAWQRLDFKLVPKGTDKTGRFAVKLKQTGSITLGYAFLQPGTWGRFKGLPDRKDVVEGLINQGVTVLRYGGSMVNDVEYRWKKMIGPRDRRPPYHGTWYSYSSNGWGIPDFLNLCDAAAFLGVPAFNMDETPQDMADFVEYVNGPADSEWGRKRVADGHPMPYRLKYLELGNEERVGESYWRKFKPLAEAIWRKDANLIPVVGDFAYREPIHDPFDFQGSDAGLHSLATHQQILALAKSHNAEVWFDVHLDTSGPGISPSERSLPTYVDAIDAIAGGAKHAVVVFELNAVNHQQRRAMANARAIMLGERLVLPIVTSANCLQPDGQNDNGWDQGLLFLNPSQVWLQPPGYVTQMISLHYEPFLVNCEVESPDNLLFAEATRSQDGHALVLQVLNFNDHIEPVAIHLTGFTSSKRTAMAEELAGPLSAVNDSKTPDRIKVSHKQWRPDFVNGDAAYTLQPYSFTVLGFE
jgi:Domain of Unknown Function (DUF1080)/Alpha-L-arabinofuranosidase C-terminal domain